MGTDSSLSPGTCVPLLLLLIFVFCVNSELICGFGANNTAAFKLRNKLTLERLDYTLFIETIYATHQIHRVSNFNLSRYLEVNLKVNLRSYSNYVSIGNLLTINWTAVTQHNRTNSTSLPSLIRKVYVDPAHNSLQYVVNYTGMSYGIFRPLTPYFPYMGVNYVPKRGYNYLQFCYSVSRVVLSVPTNMTYLSSFHNVNSSISVLFTDLFETVFNNFFRRNSSEFSNDFVRVNVLNLTALQTTNSSFSLNATGIETEFYFRSLQDGSYIQSYVMNNSRLLSCGFFFYQISVNASGIELLEYSTAPPPTSLDTISTEPMISPTKPTETWPSTTTPEDAISSATFFSDPSPDTTIDNTTEATTTESTSSTSTLPTTESSLATNESPLFATSPTKKLIVGETTITTSTVEDDHITSAYTTHSWTETTFVQNKTTTDASTTFDPDPLFLPSVAVLPKKYNDPVLLPRLIKFGNMAPMSAKEAILHITIPLAVGVIGFIIGIMVCLQSVMPGK